MFYFGLKVFLLNTVAVHRDNRFKLATVPNTNRTSRKIDFAS